MLYKANGGGGLPRKVGSARAIHSNPAARQDVLASDNQLSLNFTHLAFALAVAALLSVACLAVSPAHAHAAVDFSQHTVDTVSPAGTTINLFDYWMTDRNDPDDKGNVGAYQENGGINTGHPFKFVNGGEGGNNGINQWTGSGKGPKTGIVADTLVSNMPQLTQANGGQSLAYLFDPSNTETAFRAAYTGVSGLLQVDDQGYFYYNSQENFASYDENGNKFNVYDAPAVITHDGNNSVPDGQFFPFNIADQVFKDELGEGGKLAIDGGITATDKALNHWFGLTMSSRFVQPAGGIANDKTNTPMTYEFSGDDDVWIFIDGVLVGDLGGIHDANRIRIDFSTGKVVTYRDLTGNHGDQGGTVDGETTIREAFEKAGVAANLNGDTFADGTYHTLKFFYLERGNYASNMNLRFNLVTVPESQIAKVDQMGNPIPGVTFELWGQDNIGTEENSEWVRGKHQVAEGTTDENGKLVLVDPITEEPFSFDLLYTDPERKMPNGNPYTHFVLEEMNAPEGYRSSDSMQLEYHPSGSTDFGGHVSMVNEDIWKTGAYASSGVLVSAPSKIFAYDPNMPDGKGDVEINQDKGTLFAVILKYEGSGAAGLGDTSNWKVVSGDSLNGWTTKPANSIGEVAAAARGGAGYAFTPTTSGAHEVMIDELPGDLDNYYNYINDIGGDPGDTKYTVAYYHTAGSLSEATGENTTRLYIDSSSTAETYRRQFSVNLQVPNIKNFLYVQKTDAEWKPITDGEGNEGLSATFSLYAEDQVDTASGEPMLIGGAQPYDTVSTKAELTVDGRHVMDSGAQFPSTDKVLKEGTYYLAEDAAPDGYKKRAQLTKVVVTNSGVFADAGTASDDVRVRTGVGHLVKTMARFATSEQIDNTLQDITAQLMVSENGPVYSQQGGWQVDWALAVPEQKMDLTYAASNAVLQYGLTSSLGQEGGDTFEDVTIMADSGWSSLAIKQNYGTPGGTPSSANKQELGEDVYLNRLFSESTTVQIANHTVATMSVEKKGENLPESQASTEFSMTLKLWNEDKAGAKTALKNGTVFGIRLADDQTASAVEVGGQGSAAVNKSDDTGSWTEYVFKLKAGQKVLIGVSTDEDGNGRLPAGAHYELTEASPGNSYDSPTLEHDKGVLERTPDEANPPQAAQVVVTNRWLTGLAILKVDPKGALNPDGTYGESPLDGVEFKLFEANAEGTAPDETKLVGQGMTANGGKLAFDDIAQGTYFLKETKALGGYQLLASPMKVVVANGVVTFYNGDGSKYGEGVLEVAIENSKVPTLPRTGGIGTWPLHAAGVVLMGGAAFAIARGSRGRRGAHGR